MIWASSTPGAKVLKPMLGRCRRNRSRASFMAMRASQVERLDSPRKSEIRKSPNVGFLNDVLGLAIVAQNASGYPVKPAVVRLHDRTDGRFIACAGAPDQFGVGGRGGGHLTRICAAHDDSAAAVARYG
jgi:hypothetical protein